MVIKTENQSRDSGFEDCQEIDLQNYYNDQLRESHYQLQLQQYQAWMYYQQQHDFDAHSVSCRKIHANNLNISLAIIESTTHVNQPVL